MGKIKLTNEEILEKGLKKARAIFVQHLVRQLKPLCQELLVAAEKNRTFMGWSGNTQTSYMCLIYLNSKVIAEVSKEGVRINPRSRTLERQEKYKEPPRRIHLVDPGGDKGGRYVAKVELDRFAWLSNPYEGKPRSVKGKVPVNNMTGEATSKEFLMNYSFPGRKTPDISIVITTGTEYSEYLENDLDYDVLSLTYAEAQEHILLNAFKPMDANAAK